MTYRTSDRTKLTKLFALNARLVLLLAAVATVLAGCQRGGSAPAAPAVGAPSTDGAPAGVDDSTATEPSTAGSSATTTGAPSDSGTPCPPAIARQTYVRAVSAQVDRDTVLVTANPAHRVCGAPNNSHFELEPATERLTLTASATVILLSTTRSGIGHETVAPTDLPQRLVDDRFGRIFVMRGPRTAVSSFVEQYHP